MSKADEMFDELMFNKIHDNKRRVVYKQPFQRIEFNKNLQSIDVNFMFDIKTLQAINEKVKELGWNK